MSSLSVPRDAESSPELDHAVVAAGLVIAVGDSLEATNGAVRRSLRLMLGDHTMVEAPVADLGGTLDAARPRGPVVVLVEDAPPDVLDQLPGAAADEQVRLVVTTRPSAIRAVLDRQVLEALAPHVVVVPGAPSVPTDLHAAGRLAARVTRAVTDRHRLGVRGPLDLSTVTALVRCYSDDGVPPVTTWQVIDAVKAAERSGLIGPDLRAVTAVVDRAEQDAWSIPAELGTMLARHEDGPPVVAVRAALGRSEPALATALLGRAGTDTVPAVVAAAMGVALLDLDDTRAAISWFAAVAQGGDDQTVTRMARRCGGILAFEVEQDSQQAFTLLEPLGEDHDDRALQLVLARATSDGTARRERLVWLGEGNDAVAVDARALLAGELLGGQDEAALPVLARTVAEADPAEAAFARGRRIQALERLGRRDEALREAEAACAALSEADPEGWHHDAAAMCAQVLLVAERPHDAEQVLLDAVGDAGPRRTPTWLAVSDEVDLALGREWQLVGARPAWEVHQAVHTYSGSMNRDVMLRRVAVHVEAARRLGRHELAEDLQNEARKQAGTLRVDPDAVWTLSVVDDRLRRREASRTALVERAVREAREWMDSLRRAAAVTLEQRDRSAPG